MKKIKKLKYFFVVFLAACSTTQNINNTTITGEDYMQMGQYNEALTFYENNINNSTSKGKNVNGEIYGKAGIASFKLDNINKAMGYFEKAANHKYKTAETLNMQAKCYKQIDNLSKEITVLENYIHDFPSDKNIANIKTRLFETCLESENWELAEELWGDFGQTAENDKKLMGIYLKVNIAKNTNKSQGLAEKLLKLDTNNVIALEQMAEKYFWKAENRYQTETKAYNKNKTRSQYAKLLKALDVVTLDFKKSLGYFKKLYNIQPQKKHARYLGNIYARLDDKEKSIYYKNRSH